MSEPMNSRRDETVPAAALPMRLFEAVLVVMNSIGTAWIFVMMLLINADVFSRYFANTPIRGVPEIIGLSIVAIVFMQAGHTLRAGRFTRSDSLLGGLAHVKPRAARLLLAFHDFAGVLVMAIILATSWPLLTEAYLLGDYVGAAGYFTAPVWPVKLIIVVGAAVCAVQYLILLAHDLRALRDPAPLDLHDESEAAL